MNNCFEKKIESMIEDLAISVAKGFSDQNEKFEKRFDKLEKDNVWTKDILESHSTVLARRSGKNFFVKLHQ